MPSVCFDVKTGPCPRCQSFHTKSIVSADGKVVYCRHCLDCRFRWDYVPEFAPDPNDPGEGLG